MIRLDAMTTLHALTDGVVAMLAAQLEELDVRKGCAGMVWIFLDDEQLGAVSVGIDEGEAVLRVMDAGSEPDRIRRRLGIKVKS